MNLQHLKNDELTKKIIEDLGPNMTNENKCMIINGLKYLLQMGYEIYSPWADPKSEYSSDKC